MKNKFLNNYITAHIGNVMMLIEELMRGNDEDEEDCLTFKIRQPTMCLYEPQMMSNEWSQLS